MSHVQRANKGAAFNNGLLQIELVREIPEAMTSGDFGTATVSTPFLNAAEALSSSTSCSGMRRSNRPADMAFGLKIVRA
jgi:hypothetical protein